MKLFRFKTFPENNKWLENLYEYYQNNKENNIQIINYSKNKNTIKQIIIASSFGNVNHQTIPGSIMLKNFTKQVFYESIGAGEGL